MHPPLTAHTRATKTPSPLNVQYVVALEKQNFEKLVTSLKKLA
jgi:hypothetical protein